MNKYKITVTVPFNKEVRTIQVINCINSLLNQILKPAEIIIVGNKEKFNQIKSGVKHNKIKIYFIPFVGEKNEARNVAIAKASGDFILILDSDMTADESLLQDCAANFDKYDAIIIPEKNTGGNFWANCKKLEKQLIMYDMHTVTARFFRKNLFTKGEKPFDSRFGLLDEWGFNNNLSLKQARIGFSNSFITVERRNLSIKNEIKNKFHRGLWFRHFYKINKIEAVKRISPMTRGVFFYGKRLHYLIKEPIYFPGLILLKTIDFLSFLGGYIFSFIKKSHYV